MIVLEKGQPGDLKSIRNDLNRSLPQYVVKKRNWQGSRLKPGGKFTFLGVSVSPAFEFTDFEKGNADELTRVFPNYKE